MTKREKIISLKEAEEIMKGDSLIRKHSKTSIEKEETKKPTKTVKSQEKKKKIRNGLSTWWYENGQIECEGFFKDGKLNGLSTWWYENGQIECEGFFKDGTEVDDPRTELDENELLSPSSAPAVFIKEFCLTIFYAFLGVKLSSYIYDVWL